MASLPLPSFVHSFSIGPTSSRSGVSPVYLRMSATPFNYGQQQRARQNIRLPLLVDISEDGSRPKYDVPLPNAHLPPELTTTSLYELRLDVPLHRSVIQDAISSPDDSDTSPFGGPGEEACCYGHVVYSPDNSDDLMGAIGCAGEILIGAPSSNDSPGEAGMDMEDSGPLYVLARGSYRFRVKEIVKSFPYPIAIVDEFLDEGVQDATGSTIDDDLDGDIYDEISPRDLIKQTLQSIDKILKAQAEEAATPLSPLEKSILESSSSAKPLAQAMQMQEHSEERIAVFQTFTSSLLDIAPDERDRLFAVAMLAGELASLPSELRAKMLATTNGVERLRLVLRYLSSMLSMDSAKKIAKSLSLGGGGDGKDINIDTKSLQEAEDSQKQLQVGTPKLPSWAGQIKKGVRLEYWWDEHEGWCPGIVVEEPLKIMEEMVVTVQFDDDGSIHKLPFRGDEKARWRPPAGNSGAFD